LIIKTIETIQEIKEVAELEAETWGIEPGDTVPDHMLTAFAREGSVLLGAYEDDRLIGFTLGWLGTVDPHKNIPASQQLKLVSHMTGVFRQYRDQRVGYNLKLAQRDWALAQGLDLITWTYDPLESRNGYFNIHLLGCECDTYLRDYYGEMIDQLNEGVQSDRFRVDWWIKNLEVESYLNENQDHSRLSISNKDFSDRKTFQTSKQTRNAEGFLKPPDRVDQIDDARILVEIPPDYQAIRQVDLDLAIAWRIYTRQIFEGYFSKGYKVVDFVYQKQPDPRSFYILEISYED